MGAATANMNNPLDWAKEKGDQFGQWARDQFKPPKMPSVPAPPPPPSPADAAVRAAAEAARRRGAAGGRRSTFLTGALGAGKAPSLTPPKLTGK